MLAPRTDGVGHVRQADRSAVADNELVRDLARLFVVATLDQHAAVEGVGIRNLQGAGFAEDDDRMLTVVGRVVTREGGDHRPNRAAFELECAGDVIGRLDSDLLTRERL